MKTLPPVNQKMLLRDWRVLCEDIGERRAGSAAERRAAEFVARRWTELGLAPPVIEAFPCTSLVRARSRVQAWSGGRWRTVEAQTLVGAPGTPDGRPVEGEIVWLEMPENGAVLKRGALRGKIAVLFGPLPTCVEHHRRLVAAQPDAVIHVDERLPFSWAKSDGVYPAWVKRHGMPPTVTVPYMAAWQWRQTGVRRVRVGVRIEQRTAVSQNVIAEWPGTAPQLPAVVLTAHHDTQCGNPGADDNASGVVGLLGLARALATVPRRRTIRFISFGCEEQLSVGSTAYVAAHRRAMRGVGLVVNFDSVASPLGHLELGRVGPVALGAMAERWLARAGVVPPPIRAHSALSLSAESFGIRSGCSKTARSP